MYTGFLIHSGSKDGMDLAESFGITLVFDFTRKFPDIRQTLDSDSPITSFSWIIYSR